MSIQRVRTVFTGVAGTPWYSNMYFDDDGVTPTAAENADAVDDFWEALAPLIDNGVTWTIGPEIPILDETDGTLTSVEAITVESGSGTAAGDPLPYATQGLGKLSTSDFVAGRRVQGRVFIPGMSEAASDATGKPASTTITSITDALTTLVASSGLIVWSRPFEGAEGPPERPPRDGSKASITGVSAWTQWAVMRSRRD